MAQAALRTQLRTLAPQQPRATCAVRRQRAAVLVTRAAASPDLTPEQLQRAIDNQLRLSAQRAAEEADRKQAVAAKAAAEAASAVPERKQTRAELRKAAAAAQEEADEARKRSEELQLALAARLRELEGGAVAEALRTQLKQSGTFDEGAPEEEAPAPKGPVIPQPAVFEDGSLLFTSEALDAVSIEDVLTA